MGCQIEGDFNFMMLFDLRGAISWIHFLFIIKKRETSLWSYVFTGYY